jgi:flagellum-specific ATP synthase
MNAEDLINIGAYKKGSSAEIDEAILKYPQILTFLKQGTSEKVSIDESVKELLQLVGKG